MGEGELVSAVSPTPSQCAWILSCMVFRPEELETLSLVILEKCTFMVRKCRNGNLGFNFVSAEKESKWPLSGVIVLDISENINVDTNNLQKGDWIWKVNGRDLSKATHGEAVEEFRRAKEPIVVEVLRRSSSMEPPRHSPPPPALSDGCTQTEWTGGWETPPTGLYPFVHGGFSSSSVYHQMALLGNDVINNYRPIMEADQDEDDVGCDFEYEEVTLRRTGSSEKLGLTLCYRAPDEPDTDIFVSEIEADSVAAKDGRIQEGDQLLQINGVDVHNREQAVALFATRRSDFTLLLARPQMEEYLLNEHTDRNGTDICQNHDVLMEEDDLTTDTGTSQRHEKDSGVGRTDESTRNDESSEHELDPDPPLKCASTSTSNLQSDTSLDREMARLNQEMASIRLECESLVSRHHQRRSDKKQSVERWVQSNLTLELSPLGDHHGSLMSLVSTAEKGTQLQESDVASIFSCESCRRCCRTIQLRGNEDDCGERSKKRTIIPKGKDQRNRNYVAFLPTAATMYTNQANLQHTILIQQQLFREALASSRVHRRTAGSVSCPSSPSKALGTVKEEEELRMEWKVKRRSDGSRYIARRPVRNRLLKERALKITEERTGLTTDDDAISELKVGRYWSKEERKRHLERARDRKRKEMLLRSARLASAEECSEKPNIVELSQRKLMARHRGKAVFDDFTTVQEVLAHGNRLGGPKTFGLLSVTTV